MIVYRGLDLTGSPELAQGFLASCQNSLQTGEPLALPGYTPCTINAQAEFFGNVKMTIEAISVVMVGEMEALLDCDSGVVVVDIRQMPNGWEIIATQVIAGEQEGQPQEQQVPAEQKGMKAGPPIPGRRAAVSERTGNQNKDEVYREQNVSGIYRGRSNPSPHIIQDNGTMSYISELDEVLDVQDEEPTPREPDPVNKNPYPYPKDKGMKARRIIGVGDNGYTEFNEQTGRRAGRGGIANSEETMDLAQQVRTDFSRRNVAGVRQPDADPNDNGWDVGKDAAPAIIDARTNKIKPQRTAEERALIGVEDKGIKARAPEHGDTVRAQIHYGANWNKDEAASQSVRNTEGTYDLSDTGLGQINGSLVTVPGSFADEVTLRDETDAEERALIGVSREQQQEPELQAVEVGPMPYPTRKGMKARSHRARPREPEDDVRGEGNYVYEYIVTDRDDPNRVRHQFVDMFAGDRESIGNTAQYQRDYMNANNPTIDTATADVIEDDTDPEIGMNLPVKDFRKRFKSLRKKWLGKSDLKPGQRVRVTPTIDNLDRQRTEAGQQNNYTIAEMAAMQQSEATFIDNGGKVNVVRSPEGETLYFGERHTDVEPI